MRLAMGSSKKTSENNLIGFREKLKTLQPDGLPLQLYGMLKHCSGFIYSEPWLIAALDKITTFMQAHLSLLSRRAESVAEEDETFWLDLYQCLLGDKLLDDMPFLYVLMTLDKFTWRNLLSHYERLVSQYSRLAHSQETAGNQSVLHQVIHWLASDLAQRGLLLAGEQASVNRFVRSIDALSPSAVEEDSEISDFYELSSGEHSYKQQLQYTLATNTDFKAVFSPVRSLDGVEPVNVLAGLAELFIRRIQYPVKPVVLKQQWNEQCSSLANRVIKTVSPQLMPSLEQLTQQEFSALQFYGALTQQFDRSGTSLMGEFKKALQSDDLAMLLPCLWATDFAKRYGAYALCDEELDEMVDAGYIVACGQGHKPRDETAFLSSYKKQVVQWNDAVPSSLGEPTASTMPAFLANCAPAIPRLSSPGPARVTSLVSPLPSCWYQKSPDTSDYNIGYVPAVPTRYPQKLVDTAITPFSSSRESRAKGKVGLTIRAPRQAETPCYSQGSPGKVLFKNGLASTPASPIRAKSGAKSLPSSEQLAASPTTLDSYKSRGYSPRFLALRSLYGSAQARRVKANSLGGESSVHLLGLSMPGKKNK